MRVTLEPQLSKCLNWSSKLTGVMIARPLEVRSSPGFTRAAPLKPDAATAALPEAYQRELRQIKVA